VACGFGHDSGLSGGPAIKTVGEDRASSSDLQAGANSVDSAPIFREAFKRRRCIVPALGFLLNAAIDQRGDRH
jgi:putative SOS response-associated peptidase YedK